jgi:predicted pyridoxine 5'-phosphate oxidase superfamily flavin-nucleotide-binding protein
VPCSSVGKDGCYGEQEMKEFTEKAMNLIRKREFVSVATSDLENNPNAAPKFVLKVDHNFVYLIDYIMGRTYQNLTVNPKASLSLYDPETLKGYQLNGPVEIIDKGPVFKQIFRELDARKISLTAKHIIEEIRGGAKHESFEVIMPDKFVILKVCIEEVAEINPTGELTRKRL